jgi:hypothetical protein
LKGENLKYEEKRKGGKRNGCVQNISERRNEVWKDYRKGDRLRRKESDQMGVRKERKNEVK